MAEELTPDIVMTDIKMPYMDGLTLCRKLKELSRTIRVIIFSGFDEFEYAKEAIKMEAEEYLLKPVNAVELKEVFERVKNDLDQERAEKRDTEKLKSYYMESLPEMTPVQFLSDGTREGDTRAGNLLGAMRYTSDEMTHSLHELSSGQMAKVLFLKMNLEKADVLLLDEPTRNFSPLSAPVIRHVIQSYGGCVIAVSQDRMFIKECFDGIYQLYDAGVGKVEAADVL